MRPLFERVLDYARVHSCTDWKSFVKTGDGASDVTRFYAAYKDTQPSNEHAIREGEIEAIRYPWTHV